MVLRSWIIVLSVFFMGVDLSGQNPDSQFISPLKIPLYLSSNFGELRPDHFHSGIDIKTEGVIGKEVVASADGFVYLLLVSPTGFGNAIFIRHPNGYSTVYCHLDRYSPEIEEYVKTIQYQNKSFAVTIYPPSDRITVKQGQIIGYTGNTGSSGGPHLHYEVRKTDGEKPVDPLKFNFEIQDNLKPVIERLVIYPGAKSTVTNGRSGKLFLNLTGSDGSYTLPENTELTISGPAGFGISSHDYLNNTPNRFGVNSLELMIDSIPWFSYEMNEFSFFETRYINAHIDYESYLKNGFEIEKLFVLPNDRLGVYKNYMNSGLFDFNDGKRHKVTITVKDGSDNKSVLTFYARAAQPKQASNGSQADSCSIVMPFGKSNLFTSTGIKVEIPAGSLFDTLFFNYSSIPGNGRLFSQIHKVHNRYTPVFKAYKLTIRPDIVPPGKESKLLIVQVDDKKRISSIGGIFSEGVITSDVMSFGNFAVGIDTVAPVIYANGLTKDPDYTGKTELRIRITDDLSGIKSYSGIIDGKWALFEYDAKSEIITYKFDETRISKGSPHKLVLTVTDNRNNSATHERDFIW